MCGIAGILHTDGQPISRATLRSATTALRHRGPDDEGYLLVQTRTGQVWSCGGPDTDPRLHLPDLRSVAAEGVDLGLGFRRLSILDVSIAGHQPMATADGRYWIVFNGEIYNYLELRGELSRLGHTFKTGADTEVLLAAYAEWGKACLNRFVGMFAFAILDTRARRLLLVRDFFGIKPLYYTVQNGTFAFASEIKALLELPDIARVADPAALLPYLRDGITDQGDHTLFAGIHQLPAAHFVEIALDYPGPVAPQRYWELQRDTRLDLSLQEAARHTCELFLDNLRLHLRSDVPVGAALSGGIDSSAIVMGMRQVQGETLDIHTFSYIADEQGVSEETWVDLVGAAAGASIHKIRPRPDELVSDLERLIAVQDEPFGSTSIYAQNRVFNLAHEAGIKVMEDGQGADEMLGGYHGHVLSRLISLLRQARWRDMWRLSRSQSLLDNVGMLLIGHIAKPLLPSFARELATGRVGRDLGWLNAAWFTERGVRGELAPVSIRRDQLRTDLVSQLTQTHLPMLLRYEDRNSMAHSIESRVPFLTPALVEFVLALPEEYIIGVDGWTKTVFRHAMRGIVPDPVLARRDKIGFSTPEQQWLSNLRPWVYGILGGETLGRIGAVKRDKIVGEWHAVVNGTKPFNFRLWRWINLARWADAYRVNFD